LPARADRSPSGLSPTFHLPIKDQPTVRNIAMALRRVRTSTGLIACPEIMLGPDFVMAELDTTVSALHPAPTNNPPPCASDGIRSGRVQVRNVGGAGGGRMVHV